MGGASTEEPPRDVNEDSTAWLLYTSGTTGFPKGAMLTHRNLITAAMESVIEYEPRPDDIALVAFPLCHVSGYSVPVNHLRGGTIVLTPLFEPELWMKLVDRHGITVTSMAPTMLNMILQHPKLSDYGLGTLRGIGYGAAAMPVEVLRAALDRFGPIVYSGFGMTELGGNVLTFPKSAHERAVNGEEHLLGSCGTPMCLADVKVVDEHMSECPPGVVGEIVIRGEQVFKGYFRNDEQTTKSFDDGWFQSVTAVVVLRPGATATEADIIGAARDRLAGCKKPKRVIFVDELPKTVSGKIIKRELRDQYKEPTA